jgi:hypothetical protein
VIVIIILAPNQGARFLWIFLLVPWSRRLVAQHFGKEKFTAKDAKSTKRQAQIGKLLLAVIRPYPSKTAAASSNSEVINRLMAIGRS